MLLLCYHNHTRLGYIALSACLHPSNQSTTTIAMPRSSSSKKSTPAKRTTAGAKRRLDFEGDTSRKELKQTSIQRTAAAKRTTKASSSSSSSPSSPQAASKRRAVVTPEDAADFVPRYIHKNVGYHLEGQSALSDEMRAVYNKIVATHIIPADLESSRTFGPKSGSCYEARVVQAYSLGRLEPLDDNVKICTACAATGHKRAQCPTLI